MGKRQSIIRFKHARFYDADHSKLFQPRHHTGRSYITLRRNHGNLAADNCTQRIGYTGSQNNIKSVCL